MTRVRADALVERIVRECYAPRRRPADVATLKRHQLGTRASCVACRGRVIGEPPDHADGRLYCSICGRTVALLSRYGGWR